MAGKMNATTVAAMVVVVIAMTTMSIMSTAEAARLDLSSILGYIGINEESATTYKQQSAACCDFCPCTRSLPPQCQCTDIKPYCHAECKACRCTKSIPPQCRCMDIDDFCYPPCSSSSPNDAAAAAFVNGIAN